MTGPEPTVASIIEGLGQPGPVPRPALDEAASRWNECAPAFLELIERAATSDLADATGMDAVFLVVHLCAQMQETRAFRPILRLVRADRAVIEDLLGDTTTATLPRVVAAVFDGDVAPLHQAILDAQADEYVRWSLFDALAILTRDGRVPRASTLEFLRSCFDALQSCGAEEVWTALLEAVARLGLDELRPQAEAALRAERVISELMSQEEFDDVFAGTLRGDQDPIWRTEPFGTVAEELANWQHNTTEEFEKAENEPLDLGYREKPATNPFRNVGRNDPCPCGSGKKYKKCCLAA